MKRSNRNLPKPTHPVRSVFFRCAEENCNSYKFWAGFIDPTGYLYVERGRIGCKNPAVDIYEYPSTAEANRELDSVHIRKRLKNGYEEGNPPSLEVPMNYDELGETASDVQSRINLIKARFDEIQGSTSVKFNLEQGTFSSQCGAITAQALTQAKRYLNVIKGQDKRSNLFQTAALDYLKIVPMPVGGKLDTDQLLGTTRKVERQEEVLNTLEWGLNQVQIIRELVQTALQSKIQVERSDRSHWMVWGDVEPVNDNNRANPVLQSDRGTIGITWE